MNIVVWVNGVIMDAGAPVVTATDHGLTVGDGVFETMAVVNGKPFALTRHIARLAYSAQRMGIDEAHRDLIREGVAAVRDAAATADQPFEITRMRLTLVSGPGPMSSVRGEGPASLIVTATDAPAPKRCRAVRAPWVRNERSAIAGVKSTSYAENVVMAQFAAGKGADEAIVANTHGHLCEGTATNIFIEVDDEILTPPLASGCLPGITRGLALEWGARAGLPIRPADVGELDMSVLERVREGAAFAAVSSSTRGVQPLDMLDGVALKPGPLLARLSRIFDEFASDNPDPVPPRQK
ncbi:aminotransferase class IV [Demequina aurantiaca]|uniref:aminotransferase class IV n=1 Tax=Demequina aurantiaca TaxID=676200 RepID=UPI0007855707|nr:aminotransferase class IV [Demequina aurantiaca]